MVACARYFVFLYVPGRVFSAFACSKGYTPGDGDTAVLLLYCTVPGNTDIKSGGRKRLQLLGTWFVWYLGITRVLGTRRCSVFGSFTGIILAGVWLILMGVWLKGRGGNFSHLGQISSL